MTRARRAAVLIGCVAVALLTAWYAGSRFAPPAPTASPGTVRLGPESGEPVADYLARLPAELPPAGVVVPALVQLSDELDPVAALATVAGSVPSLVVFRVPLPRVQTALRFAPLEDGVDVTIALGSARERARAAATADAGRLAGRPGDIAAVEAAALDDPGCGCVLAVLVRADRVTLEMLSARPGVRAVQGAPPGTTDRELALSPLLPGQVERADPVPDDGPVPVSATPSGCASVASRPGCGSGETPARTR